MCFWTVGRGTNVKYKLESSLKGFLRAREGCTLKGKEARCPLGADVTHLDVLLAVDVHVDEGAEADETLPHLRVALPVGQNEESKTSTHALHLRPCCDVERGTDI